MHIYIDKLFILPVLHFIFYQSLGFMLCMYMEVHVTLMNLVKLISFILDY
jgi:hypothetical protein